MVEKLTALSDRARTEPRDLYDVWNLLETTDIRIGELRSELTAKLEFRGRTMDGIAGAIEAKDSRLARAWTGRLAHQVGDLPGFDDVFRRAVRALREADLS